MRAVIYARYSTDRQNETSIEDQLRVCRDRAAREGWEVIAEHVDEGISGSALGNRPGALAAIADGHAGRYNVLILMELLRFARGEDLAKEIQRFKFRGVRVIGVQDGFDSTARTARMQAGFASIQGGEFIEMISRRTHSALELRARDGRPTGGKAFADPDLVREIFTRYADGESLFAIASDLNLRQIPSPGAAWKQRSRPRGKWLVSALHSMIKNERYVGRLVWNRSQWVKDPDTGKRHRRLRPRSEWIVRECEQLVDETTWSRAQARFAPNPGKGGVSSYVLSGLLVCGMCGGKLIVVGGSQRRYVCGTRHAGGDAACPNRSSVARLVAEKRLLDKIKRDFLSPAAEEVALREMRAARAAAEAGPQPAEDRELAELDRLVRAGILSTEVAQPAIDAARRKAATRRADPVEGLPWPTRERWRAAAAAAWDVLRGDDVGAARSLLRELVGEVRCVPDGDHIVAESAAGRVLLGTGSGIWFGSGGLQRTRIPMSTRPGGRKRP